MRIFKVFEDFRFISRFWEEVDKVSPIVGYCSPINLLEGKQSYTGKLLQFVKFTCRTNCPYYFC